MLAALCLLASADTGAQTPNEKIRGMTVSRPTDGSEWGSDAMVHTMAELKEMGITWISIHPYAHQAHFFSYGLLGALKAQPGQIAQGLHRLCQ